MEIKIGILLPRSDMFPTLALDFLNGLKLSFNKENTTTIIPKYIVEGIGTASDDGLIRIAEKMILQEDVALVISFCSLFKLSNLASVFNSYQKPLIHVGLCGNAIKEEHVSSQIIYHSLNIWQSSYAAGVYAAKTYGKKAAMASSYYDGGYQHSAAFVQGFMDEGGEIANYFVAQMDYKEETYAAMLDGIRECNPDVVFTLFSFKEGIKVMEILSKSDLNGKVPFMAIPLLTDETINKEDLKLEKMLSVASWSFSDDNPQMKAFIEESKSAYNKPPNIMGLLGYEIGQALAMTINTHEGIPANFSEAFKKYPLDSPRGTLTYNKYNESQVDSFKIRKFQFNQVGYHNVVIETMDASFSENLYSKFEEQPYAGWQNPYICT